MVSQSYCKMSRHLSSNLAFVKPYVLSVLPPGTTPIKHSSSSVASQHTHNPSSVLQATSSISLLPVQLLAAPFIDTNDSQSRPPHTIRLLTSSPNAKSPLFFITTPVDKAAATAEGSALWMLCMQPWGEQIDELVELGSYSEALALLDTVDKVMLPDKVRVIIFFAFHS
jgi:hypothetical protein